MVTEGLNKIAIALGKQAREALETEVIGLDVAVAQSQHEYDVLKRQAEEKNLATNRLWKTRDVKTQWLLNLEADLRELNRPRDGFPYLNDVEYESRMHELRVKMQESAEEMSKP